MLVHLSVALRYRTLCVYVCVCVCAEEGMGEGEGEASKPQWLTFFRPLDTPDHDVTDFSLSLSLSLSLSHVYV